MSQPSVVIDEVAAGHSGVAANTTHAGMYLREQNVNLTMQCSEPEFDNKLMYPLLYTVCENTTERLELQFNGTAGVFMQLANASTSRAKIDVFESDAFVPSNETLKTVVQELLNKSLPSINKALTGYALPFPAAAVPMVPNPSVATISSSANDSSYVAPAASRAPPSVARASCSVHHLTHYAGLYTSGTLRLPGSAIASRTCEGGRSARTRTSLTR